MAEMNEGALRRKNVIAVEAPAQLNAEERDLSKVGAGELGDYVLNLTTPNERLTAAERQLAHEEIHRQGYGTHYDNAQYPTSICLTIAKLAPDVELADVRRATAILQSIRPSGHVQYCRFPYPYANGIFEEIFTGSLAEFIQGLDK